MSAAIETRAAWSPASRFVAAGGVMVVGGGIVAAFNSSAPFAHGS